MPRTRRYIKSDSVYEISFRARGSLPFACTQYMNLLLKSILARVQCDNKVILHHFIFEGSHPHIICTAKDADQCQRFYGQLQKQITDSIKRLLNLAHLNIWEGRASVIKLESLDDVIDKTGYLYANPSNDDLETCIERYPGLSSWEIQLEANSVDEALCFDCPWIRQPMIPALRSRSVTARQDASICNKMLSAAKKSHLLQVYPYEWIAHFVENPNADDLAQVKAKVLDNLRQREERNSQRRAKTSKRVIGAAQLKRQPLLQRHSPKKRGRKIFAQSMYKELRQRIIEEIKHIDALCRSVYERWKGGDFSVLWPPGTFPPPLPPMANALPW